VIGGLFNAASAMDKTSESGMALAEAEKSLAAAKAALFAPITRLRTELLQNAAVLVNNIAGFREMAAAEGLATAATVTLESAMILFRSPLILVAAAIAGVKFGLDEMAASLKAFTESEDQIGRIAISLRNMGNTFPIGEVQEFADHLSLLTGVDNEAIASLAAMAIQFDLTRKQAEALVPAVLDIATRVGAAPEEVEKAILRFTSTGQTRGLLALYINPKEIKGDIHDIDNVISQLRHNSEGTAESFRSILPGEVIALKTAADNFHEAFGRLMGPAEQAWLELRIRFFEGAARLIEMLADYYHLPTAADLGKGKANPLALKGDPEQTAALKGIEEHTAVLDPLVKQVLGGKGTVARRSFTWRDQRLAFGI
jgi:hypothetical protein